MFRRVAIAFLSFQSLAAGLWWGLLWFAPTFRRPFLVPGSPDATLLSFFLPDMVLFIAGGLASAWGVARKTSWAWGVLALHTGAGVYAALYTLSLALLSGGWWIGFLLMLPTLIGLPIILWKLRPKGTL